MLFFIGAFTTEMFTEVFAGVSKPQLAGRAIAYGPLNFSYNDDDNIALSYDCVPTG